MEADNIGKKRLLKIANKDQINTLCEATVNVVKKNVPIDSCTRSKLCKHRHAITELTFKKKPLAKKRRILIQKGGFLPIILSTLLPLLASAVPELLNKNG